MRKKEDIKQRLKRKLKDLKIQVYRPKLSTSELYRKNNIEIYEEWLKFPYLFVEWSLTNGYSEKRNCLVRINTKKGFFPNNCKYVSIKERTFYRCNNIKEIINIDNCFYNLPLGVWAKYFKVLYKTLKRLVRKSLHGEEIIRYLKNKKLGIFSDKYTKQEIQEDSKKLLSLYEASIYEKKTINYNNIDIIKVLKNFNLDKLGYEMDISPNILKSIRDGVYEVSKLLKDEILDFLIENNRLIV